MLDGKRSKEGIEWRAKRLKQKRVGKRTKSNLSEPRYSKVPSKQRRGPNRGAISEGSRGASATWGSGLPCFDVGRCDVGDPRVLFC